MQVDANDSKSSVDLPEVFETVEDRERREWSSAGADWSYYIVRFLQGRRRLEIQPSELVKTRLYARSDDFEKRALEMVCATEREIPPSLDDEQRLRSRDQMLLDYVEGRNFGHADVVAAIRAIPAKVAERQQFDRAVFEKVWPSPVLFAWLFEGKRTNL